MTVPIPPLAAGATFAKPGIGRKLAPAEPPFRDYGGYTDDPPKVTWPGGKKLALNIVVHLEEGAEMSVSLANRLKADDSPRMVTITPRPSWAR